MGQALVFGLIGSSALVVGGAISAYWRAPQQVSGVLLAFASGTLISALAFELFPEAVHLGGRLGLAGRHAYARGVRARPAAELDGHGGRVLAVVRPQRLSATGGAAYGPACGASSVLASGTGETSTLSTRHPSMSKTSKECPSSSKRSPAAGTRPKASIAMPPTVW